eukprot:5156850-Prymnesium_polylepis.2
MAPRCPRLPAALLARCPAGPLFFLPSYSARALAAHSAHGAARDRRDRPLFVRLPRLPHLQPVPLPRGARGCVGPRDRDARRGRLDAALHPRLHPGGDDQGARARDAARRAAAAQGRADVVVVAVVADISSAPGAAEEEEERKPNRRRVAESEGAALRPEPGGCAPRGRLCGLSGALALAQNSPLPSVHRACTHVGFKPCMIKNAYTVGAPTIAWMDSLHVYRGSQNHGPSLLGV